MPHTERSPSPEETFLTVLTTASVLQQDLGRLLRRFELTPTQYNVLRILRGSEPTGLPSREVGRRLVTAVPDVTRILDRMVRRNLVRKRRSDRDRRVVIARITTIGLTQLERVQDELMSWLDSRTQALDATERRALVATLDRLRAFDTTTKAPVDPADFEDKNHEQ